MMTTNVTSDEVGTSQNSLKDIKVRLKLATLWTSSMFLYIYVDYFHFYMPGQMDDILKGKVFVFDITQRFLTGALILMTIPALMIFLSVALPAKVSRWMNIIVGSLFIPINIFNLAGLLWVHMVLAVVVEVALLGLIIRYAWKWGRNNV